MERLVPTIMDNQNGIGALQGQPRAINHGKERKDTFFHNRYRLFIQNEL